MLGENNKRLWLTCMAVLSIAANGQQSVYHWTDENGQVHYGDRPPVDVPAYETIRETSRASSKPEVIESERVPAVPESADAEQRSSSPSSGAVQPARQHDFEYCQRVKDNLWQIENSARVRVVEGDGQYRFMSPEEKEAARLESLRLIETHCD